MSSLLRLLLMCATVCFLSVLAGCGGGGNRAPEITAAQVTPAALTFRGGDVDLTVTAADAGGVARVTARVVSAASNEIMELALVNGQWTGRWAAPSNATDEVINYTVTFIAMDAAGLESAPVARAFTVSDVTSEPTPPLPPPPAAP